MPGHNPRPDQLFNPVLHLTVHVRIDGVLGLVVEGRDDPLSMRHSCHDKHSLPIAGPATDQAAS